MKKPKINRNSTASAPIGPEVTRALELIQAGRGDSLVAALLSAERRHGQPRIDPYHIAQLRQGA